MARHKRRNQIQEQRPAIASSSLAASFGDSVRVDMKTSDDLMNYLLYGKDARFFVPKRKTV